MAYVRVSAGVWRDTATGKTIRSSTDPNKAAPKTTAKKGTSAGIKPPSDVKNTFGGVPSNAKLNNPVDIINAQAGVNKQIADANWQGSNPNQVNNPWGSQTITKDANGNVTVDQKLSPEQQELQAGQTANNKKYLDMAGQIAGQYKAFDPSKGPQMPGEFKLGGLSAVNTPNRESLGNMPQFNIGGAPSVRKYSTDGLAAVNRLSYDGMPDLTNDFSGDRKRIEDTIYGRKSKLLDDRYQKEEAAFAQSLADRGIDPGSDIYKSQLADFRRDKIDAYDAAHSSATELGGNEQQRMYGMALSRRQQGVSERDALVDDSYRFRNQGIQEAQLAHDYDANDRDRYVNERNLQYGNDMRGRQQGWAENMDQFNAESSWRNQQTNEQNLEFNNNMNRYQTGFNNELTASREPLTALGMVNGQYSGITQPNFQPHQGYNMSNTDIYTPSLQYQGWQHDQAMQDDQQAWQGGQNAQDRGVQYAGIRAGGARGGGGGENLTYEQRKAIDLKYNTQWADYLRQNQPKPPSQPNPWTEVATGAVKAGVNAAVKAGVDYYSGS